jgi:RHS repeat-associated protein
VIDDIYSSGTDDTLSRLSGRKKGSSWIFRESYLGLGRLVEREFLDLGGGYGRLVWTLIGSSLDSPNQDYYEGLDRHGRIDHLIAKLGSTLLNEYLYSYNYNSQITLREDKVGKIGTSEEFDQGYTYDNLGRVTDHKRGGYSGSWTYITRHECFTMDRSGNVTAYYVGTSSTCGSTVPLTYNDSNELAYVNEVPYGYNKPGDMTDRGSNINKVFDAWNRIIDIDQGSGSYLARYKYNGLGQTIKRTNSSTLFDTYYYFSAESQILEELKVSDGSSISWYVWGSQYIDDIVMRGKANASDDRYYVLDARNNVTTVLSNAGSVQTRFVYDAYGMPKQLSADWSTWQTITDDLHLFTGRLFHKDHAQTDYRARLQDPELGVFVQRDPIGIWGDESQFGNVYSYTENDPTNLTDPLGLWSWDEHRRQTASAFREFWDKLGGDNPVRSDWCYNRVLDKLQNYNLSQDANDMYYHDLKRHYNRSVSNGAGGYVTDLIVAASYDAQYKTYLQSEFSYFEDAVTFGVKNCMSKRECEFFCDEAASALGHLLHSWQDYFAHAIHFPPPNKIVWTGRFGFIVNSLCSPDFTCFWLVIPSSSKPKRTLFPPMIIDSGEHGNNEVNVDFPTEGAARIRSSERYGAFKLSSAEYKDLMIDFLVTCCD